MTKRVTWCIRRAAKRRIQDLRPTADLWYLACRAGRTDSWLALFERRLRILGRIAGIL
jgi:hypothetical protein